MRQLRRSCGGRRRPAGSRVPTWIGNFSAAPASGRAARPFPELTDREFEVLRLLAEGLSNTDIARRLYLSEKTVRNHVSNVIARLKVTDRAQAIVRAHRAGLVAPEARP